MIAFIGFGIHAILPWSKGRRKRPLLRMLMCFSLFVMLYGTQWSAQIPFFYHKWTPLLIVLFALPAVVLFIGLVASIAHGAHAMLLRTGKEQWQIAAQSLLGVVVFGISIAPHTVAVLTPFIISAEDHTNRPGTLTHIGDLVPDFELTDMNGTPIRTSDLRGQVVVLNFFATWCGPCLKELPHLQAVWDEFRNNKDFRMLVVGREESDDSIKTFQQEHEFTFPSAADPNRLVFDKFASQSIPRTYLLSRQGVILYQCTGYYEDEIVKLKKLLTKELAKKN